MKDLKPLHIFAALQCGGSLIVAFDRPMVGGRTTVASRICSIQPLMTLRTSSELMMARGGATDDGKMNEVDSAAVDQPTVEFTTLPSSQTANSVDPNRKMGPNAPLPGFVRQSLPFIPWYRLPNWLTYLRCLAIPSLMILFGRPGKHYATSLVFAVASLTDWLDGYLARKWDITTPFGAFLDPVADKLMVSTALILLTGQYGAKVAVPTAIILAREIAVSALREWMAQRGKRDSVKVGFQGKIKTAVTMVALTVLLMVPLSSAPDAPLVKLLLKPGLFLLYFSAFITVTSGSVYFRAAAPVLLDKS